MLADVGEGLSGGAAERLGNGLSEGRQVRAVELDDQALVFRDDQAKPIAQPVCGSISAC